MPKFVVKFQTPEGLDERQVDAYAMKIDPQWFWVIDSQGNGVFVITRESLVFAERVEK